MPNAVEMRNVKEDIGMVDKKSNAKVVSPHLFLHRKGWRVWRSYRRCGLEFLLCKAMLNRGYQ